VRKKKKRCNKKKGGPGPEWGCTTIRLPMHAPLGSSGRKRKTREEPERKVDVTGMVVDGILIKAPAPKG